MHLKSMGKTKHETVHRGTINVGFNIIIIIKKANPK